MASSPVDAVAQARQVGVKELHVTGGSSVNSAFARAGLLDRVIINVESIMVGQGIPLIKPAGFDLHLRQSVVNLAIAFGHFFLDKPLAKL